MWGSVSIMVDSPSLNFFQQRYPTRPLLLTGAVSVLPPSRTFHTLSPSPQSTARGTGSHKGVSAHPESSLIGLLSLPPSQPRRELWSSRPCSRLCPFLLREHLGPGPLSPPPPAASPGCHASIASPSTHNPRCPRGAQGPQGDPFFPVRPRVYLPLLPGPEHANYSLKSSFLPPLPLQCCSQRLPCEPYAISHIRSQALLLHVLLMWGTGPHVHLLPDFRRAQQEC